METERVNQEDTADGTVRVIHGRNGRPIYAVDIAALGEDQSVAEFMEQWKKFGMIMGIPYTEPQLSTMERIANMEL